MSPHGSKGTLIQTYFANEFHVLETSGFLEDKLNQHGLMPYTSKLEILIFCFHKKKKKKRGNAKMFLSRLQIINTQFLLKKFSV